LAKRLANWKKASAKVDFFQQQGEIRGGLVPYLVAVLRSGTIYSLFGLKWIEYFAARAVD